jgi:hypothetical protein
MAHTYMLFDFGTDEDKAQQARHKLEGWKQAFRLDKKLQFKFDRGEAPATQAPTTGPAVEELPKPAKGTKGKEKPASKTGAKAAKAAPTASTAAAPNGDVKLLVRLYFSAHEKLSEQRWLDRIPAEEPFKNASPKVIQEGESGFSEVLAQFDRLD